MSKDPHKASLLNANISKWSEVSHTLKNVNLNRGCDKEIRETKNYLNKQQSYKIAGQ